MRTERTPQVIEHLVDQTFAEFVSQQQRDKEKKREWEMKIVARMNKFIRDHSDSALFAYSIMLVLPLFFILPSAPQTPDGAEIISTAVYGGVPHPPGFPLQSWINRFILFISPLSAITTLEVLNLIYTVATLFILSQTLKLLSIKKPYIYLSLALYLYYPVILGQSVQVEKYLLFLLLMNLMIFQSLKCFKSNKEKIVTNILLLSMFTGLSFSQHYTSIIFLPYYAFVIVSALRSKLFEIPRITIIQSILIVFLVPIFFYFSLPLLRTDAVWPDWGKMVGFKEVIKYFFAFNHGDHRIFGNAEDLRKSLGIDQINTFNPINLLMSDIISYFHITVLVAFWGVIKLLKKEKHYFRKRFIKHVS